MKKIATSRNILLAVTIGAFVVLLLPTSAYAHVTVKPAEVLPGAYEKFTTSVPNEKEVPVTGVRLIVPNDVKSVTPTAKSGWEIDIKKMGESVTEINWTGGIIDAGLRDEFTFSAKTPADEDQIIWKAYQTYQDGSVVAWDQKPADDHSHVSEDESKGPYSTTLVAEDDTEVGQEMSNTIAFAVSAAAIVISLIAFTLVIKK